MRIRVERRTVTPSLADISQDVAGEIPVDVVLHWTTGARSETRHRELLEPHLVRGTIVSSDSAGLSRLTRDRTLCEVLQLVDGPKQVLCEYGTAIGGRLLGTWVADNSQTFYSDEVPVREIVEQMIRAQREIDRLPVHIGLGFHCGEFVALGDGLFGPEVDVVELLTEDYTVGGEIAVTDAVSRRLPELLRVRLRPKSFPHALTYSLLYSGVSLRGEGPRARDAV